MRLYESIYNDGDKGKGGEEVSEFVYENCNYEYWKLVKKLKKNLYRGKESHFEIDDYEEKTSRLEDRKSWMSNENKNRLNIFFEQKFGWKVRNGVFTTGDIMHSQWFGRSYLFFPIGNFKFVWSKTIKDINDKFRPNSDDSLDKIPILKIVNEYQNTNLEEAILSGNEVIFNCKNYILVNRKHEKDLRGHE